MAVAGGRIAAAAAVVSLVVVVAVAVVVVVVVVVVVAVAAVQVLLEVQRVGRALAQVNAVPHARRYDAGTGIKPGKEVLHHDLYFMTPISRTNAKSRRETAL